MFTLRGGKVHRAALTLVALLTLTLTLACLAAPGAASGEPVTAAATGAISGTVSGPGGAPLVPGTEGDVDVLTSSGGYVTTVGFSDDGAYTVGGLAPGDYKLGFALPDVYASMWWRDSRSLATATPVHVVAGSTTGGISPQLRIGGTITGTVTGPGGAPLEADTTGSVTARTNAGYTFAASFNDDGRFAITGLSPGQYQLVFTADNSTYAASWWRNAATMGTATAVTVTPGATTGSVDQELALAGSITGTITGPNGAALADDTEGRVKVYDRAGNLLNFTGEPFAADGRYTLTGLAAGDYTLQFLVNPSLSGTSYESTWWQGASARYNATPVHVVQGGETTIDPQLALTGAISGTVTGPGGAALPAGAYGTVTVRTPAGEWAGFGELDAGGDYTVYGLPAGDYTVEFNAWGADGTTYVPTWWRDAATSATAALVRVAGDSVTTEIDQQLTVGGAITGTVSGPAGTPLVAGTIGEVRAYDGSGNLARAGEFDDSGSYTIDGLGTGGYTVEFVPQRVESFQRRPSNVYAPGWWDGTTSREAATVVRVVAGSTTSGISQHLAMYGSIVGTVSGPDGAPLAVGTSGEASLFDSAGRLVKVQRFFADGTYRFGKVTAGNYTVKFQAYDKNGNPGYLSSWWRNAASQAEATVVHVTPGSTTGNIDPQLAARPESVAAPRPPKPRIPGRLPAAVSANSKRAITLPVRTDAGQLIAWSSGTPKVCTVKRGKLRMTGKRAVCKVTASATVDGWLALSRHYRIRVT